MQNFEASREMAEKSSAEKAKAEQETLARAYACENREESEWCVSEVRARSGEAERVLHWIRPSIEAEFVAMRMATLLTALGNSAVAKKTKQQSIQASP